VCFLAVITFFLFSSLRYRKYGSSIPILSFSPMGWKPRNGNAKSPYPLAAVLCLMALPPPHLQRSQGPPETSLLSYFFLKDVLQEPIFSVAGSVLDSFSALPVFSPPGPSVTIPFLRSPFLVPVSPPVHELPLKTFSSRGRYNPQRGAHPPPPSSSRNMRSVPSNELHLM